MKPFYLVCLVALLASRNVVGQTAPQGPAAQVQALEDALNAAWLRRDTLTLGRLIGEDFRGITADGGSLAKADMLRAAAQTQENATEYTDRTARAFGNVVVTTGRITDRGRRTSGEPFTVVTLVTFVWVRRPVGWQLVAWHESFAKP
jgi:ketosteroid isomerase-like protein